MGLSTTHLLIVLIIFAPMIIGFLVMGPQKKVLIKHKQSGLTKSGYVGYCWTYYFLGWIIPIVRGEIGIGVLHFLLTVITFGIFQAIMPFLYNKQFMTRLMISGWELNDSDELNTLAKMKLGIAS